MVKHMLAPIILLIFSSIFAMAGEDHDLYSKGRKAWIKRDWAGAVEHFSELVTRFPNSSKVCKASYYVGYCQVELKRNKEAFDSFSLLIENNTCKRSTVNDAKAKRLELAFGFASSDPSYIKVLEDGLTDENKDIRLQSAVYLAQLNSKAGMDVFFQVLENETDRDLRDTAAKYILKLGNKAEKDRMQGLIDKYKQAQEGQKSTLVRLIIRNLENGDEQKINLPIGLFNVLRDALTKEQIDLIREETDFDFNSIKIDLAGLTPGTVIFSFVSKTEEIKLFVE